MRPESARALTAFDKTRLKRFLQHFAVKMFPGKPQPPAWAAEQLCEYLSFTVCIHHIVWSVGMSRGGAHSLFFSCFCSASQTLWREEERKKRVAFRLSWLSCLFLPTPCTNVSQNVRLPLQRPNRSRPHSCWNHVFKVLNNHTFFCPPFFFLFTTTKHPFFDHVYTLPLLSSTSTATNCLHWPQQITTNYLLVRNSAVSIFKQI